ncbi:MAG: SOS response-associated peptidase [Bacteroidales bacterium]|nr:SOS response-associated peptidase [Bacteroidales bacterium]
MISKRCLIPATGFFEWQHINKEKIPYYIFLPEQDIFSFAGIWDNYINDDKKEIHSFSIITCEANPFMLNIHNTKKRMPVILSQQEESIWLDENLNRNEINNLIKKKDYNFEAYTINKSLGNIKINSNTVDILKKYNYENNTLKL